LSANDVLFVSPDNLHSVDQSALVLVDEAAALAPSIIISAFKRFNNIVIATTEIGYEGSGLGFNKKLKPLLQQDNKVESIELITPIRWPVNDPLEPLFETIFTGNYSKEKTKGLDALSLNESSLSNLKFEFIDSSNKTEKQISELIECHQLLMSAHYQTTPDDLMRLLDSDDQAVIIARVNNTICGACIVVKERLEIDTELARKIVVAQRRLSGNLSLQSIASMLFDENCLNLVCWRVNRIAVLENVQNLTIGSQLLSFTEQLAINKNVDILSTSFGLEASLLRFWQSADYKLIKIGTRKDTSSGQYSGLFIKPINKDIESTISLLFLRFELTKIYLGELGVLIPEFLHTIHGTQTHHFSTQTQRAFKKLVANKIETIIASELKLTNALEELFFIADQRQSDTLLILLRKLRFKGNSAESKLSLSNQIIDLLGSLNIAS
jgi:tRNA(Met) cytidine acetyltransferase